MKKIFGALLVLLTAFMCTSCLIVWDGDGTYTNTKGQVKIENRDPYREAYINTVEYRSNEYDRWHECWNYENYGSDSYCKFKLSEGNYEFKVTVIYPNWKNNRDYYDIYYTEDIEPVRVITGETTILILDGEELYKKY